MIQVFHAPRTPFYVQPILDADSRTDGLSPPAMDDHANTDYANDLEHAFLGYIEVLESIFSKSDKMGQCRHELRRCCNDVLLLSVPYSFNTAAAVTDGCLYLIVFSFLCSYTTSRLYVLLDLAAQLSSFSPQCQKRPQIFISTNPTQTQASLPATIMHTTSPGM